MLDPVTERIWKQSLARLRNPSVARIQTRNSRSMTALSPQSRGGAATAKPGTADLRSSQKIVGIRDLEQRKKASMKRSFAKLVRGVSAAARSNPLTTNASTAGPFTCETQPEEGSPIRMECGEVNMVNMAQAKKQTMIRKDTTGCGLFQAVDEERQFNLQMKQRSDKDDLPRISDFLIQEKKKTGKHWALEVMKSLRENLFDLYTLRAIGKSDMRICDTVIRQIAKYVIVLDVVVLSATKFRDQMIVITFKRSLDFRKDFVRKKETAIRMREKQEQLIALNARKLSAFGPDSNR